MSEYTIRTPYGFTIESSPDVPKDEIWVYSGDSFIKIVNLLPEDKDEDPEP